MSDATRQDQARPGATPEELALDAAAWRSDRRQRAIDALSSLAQDPAVDWADVVADVVTAAAANAGGLDAALSRRTGSWEAAAVSQLVEGTAGQGPDELMRHRTAPVVIRLGAHAVLDWVMWAINPRPTSWDTRYDAARDELDARLRLCPEDTPDRERLWDLFDAVDAVEEEDLYAHSRAVEAAVTSALRERLPVDVAVVVHVEEDRYRPGPEDLHERIGDYLADSVGAAVEAVPLPTTDVLARAAELVGGGSDAA